MLPMRTTRRSRPRSWRVALGGAVTVVLLAAGCSYTTDLDVRVHQAASTQVFAADGSLLATLHADQNRDPVPLDRVSPYLQTAVVAAEDARFFEHQGVDPRAALRALVHDSQQGGIAEGGSTITQQYVRNVLLDRKKTVSRKLREAVLSVQVERKLTKRQILERYLNTVYFGNGVYGVQAAGRLYFGKDALDLDLAQSAMLAGLLQAPERDNPFRDPVAALTRRTYVLDRIAKLGRAPAALVTFSRAEPLGLVPRRADDRYPAGHFMERVKQLVLTNPAFGDTPEARRRTLFEGGLKISTTIDRRLQDDAEQAVAKVLSSPGSDPSAALVSLDPTTGSVRAYVGGRDFFSTAPAAQFDLAGQGRRQSGSSFKPFVLAAALQAGVALNRTYPAPATLDVPLPGSQPAWTVHNFENRSYGRIDLVEATVGSVNTVYAQLIHDIGTARVVELARAMGVQSKLDAVMSSVLGTNAVSPLEMASAYSTLAGDGLHTEPVFVTKVTRRDGTVLYEAPVQRRRVLPASIAREVTATLEQVVERGTGVNARIARPVAGKTGTTDASSDAWFVGYTPELATAVWVGFGDTQRPMTPPATRITVTGGAWPAEIWQLYQSRALAAMPVSQFPPVIAVEPTTTTTAPGPVLPSVIGLRLEDAQRVLSEGGFRVGGTGHTSGAYPPGTVTAEIPAAGTPARAGELVTLVVATGPPQQTAVPEVLATFAADATALLRASGLDAQVVTQPEPPPRDPARTTRVWKQSPPAGTVVDQGTRVTVWVNPH